MPLPSPFTQTSIGGTSGSVAAFTSGAIDGVTIGGSTPAAGSFTTATLTGAGLKMAGGVVLFIGNGGYVGSVNLPNSDTLVGLGAGANVGSQDTLTTAIGYMALGSWGPAATNGAGGNGQNFSECTAVGAGSQQNLTTGNFNTTLGLHTLYASASATGCIAIGTDTLKIGATPTGMLAIGNAAGLNTCDTNSITIGNASYTCQVGTPSTGISNLVIGHSAFGGGTSVQTSASSNVVLGNQIGAGTVTSANTLVVIGQGSCPIITSDNASVIIGYNTMLLAAATANNTVIGAYAGAKLTSNTANNNTILGFKVASTTLATGFNNILIGVNQDCDTPSSSTNNQLIIQGNSTTATITASMNGTPTVTLPGGSLFLGKSTVTGGSLALYGSTSGSVTITGGTTGLFTVANIGNGASALTISGSGQWTANGTTLVSLTAVAPAGANATVQEWLTLTDNGGHVRYIPCF